MIASSGLSLPHLLINPSPFHRWWFDSCSTLSSSLALDLGTEKKRKGKRLRSVRDLFDSGYLGLKCNGFKYLNFNLKSKPILLSKPNMKWYDPHWLIFVKDISANISKILTCRRSKRYSQSFSPISWRKTLKNNILTDISFVSANIWNDSQKSL